MRVNNSLAPNGVGSALTVTGTGSTTARTLAARAADSFNVLDWGLVPDGTTDNTAALNTLLSAVYAAGGGEVYFPPAATAYLFSGQIVFPNDAGSPPKQRPITLRGAGSYFDGTWTPNAAGGSMLDLRYAGAGAAKVVTRGSGRLRLDGLIVCDNSSGGAVNSVPFLFTTCTTLLIADCTFQGNPSKSGTTCDQDAIILGGTTTTVDGTDTCPFQGYGTVIERSYFHRVRRAVYGQVFANGVVVRDNTVSLSCGSGLTGGACIEFLGNSGNVDYGNVITANLIEMVHYPYGIKLANASNNTIAFNNFYDGTATTLAYIRLESTAIINLVIAGCGADTYPTLSDAVTGSNANTLITPHQGQQSVFAQPVTFSNAVGVAFLGTATFEKGDGGFVVQPAAATGTESAQLMKVLRWAAEGTNPGAVILQLLQNGTLNLLGANGGNITTPQVTWTGGGRNIIAVGTGGGMVQDSGTGGSYFDHKNYGVRFYDHNSGPLRALIGAGADAIKLGAASDAILQRSSASTLEATGHLRISGGTPTVAAGAGAGTAPTVSISGSDQDGVLTVTTGTAPASGVLATVTFGAAFAATPRCVTIAAGGPNAPGVIGLVYSDSAAWSTTTWTLNCASALTASTAYKFAYHVGG